ncbi:hypothetical protein V8C35DRAFT_129181 [Trichoderma chlorosporum]
MMLLGRLLLWAAAHSKPATAYGGMYEHVRTCNATVRYQSISAGLSNAITYCIWSNLLSYRIAPACTKSLLLYSTASFYSIGCWAARNALRITAGKKTPSPATYLYPPRQMLPSISASLHCHMEHGAASNGLPRWQVMSRRSPCM